MYNKSPVKLPAREQDPIVRRGNFKEVSLGYSAEMAVEEASRCLNCKHQPCVEGCPVNVQIPKFIGLVKEGEFEKAYEVIRETNSLPAICGRVCPQESQCEAKCVRAIKGDPVGIGRLERFCADYAMARSCPVPELQPKNGKKVAVVGSGPAGLTCAGDLARLGYEVTIFEALHTPGGVLIYGIPEFRLPKRLVKQEIESVEAMGVKIEKNVVVGRSVSLDDLFDEGYSAVFVGSGAGLPKFQNIPGENLNGVYSANEFLTRINFMKAYTFPESDTPVRVGRRVAVIGGGNVAMDAVRTAKRLGAEDAVIVYRRTKAEMPARVEEVHHAEQEGVRFELLVAPLEVIGNDKKWVTGLKCQRMQLGEPDKSGRRSPVAIPGSEFVLECDVVVVAIGTRANPLLTATCPELKLNKRGNIEADEHGMTSLPGVFAGGDIVRGAATVILAMGDGKKSAQAIDDYLRKPSASATV